MNMHYIYIYISLEMAAFMQGDINIAQMSCWSPL